ncbi:MAG: hypothetical protein M0Z99_32170 [Betaproteobacteria bacterium]|nr:hypothetical protein [Betaproteobacteria bacterium]
MTSEITYLDIGTERDVPHELVNVERVSRPIERTVTINGRKVVERTRLEYTIATARRLEK